jgi:NAD-dependent dihydropyrimidine dehydrogenase PreA subunit
MGRFVDIALAGDGLGPGAAETVVRACPVDIFVVDGEGDLGTDSDREDECILCGRCVAVAPGAVSVTRAYGARRPVVVAEGADG